MGPSQMLQCYMCFHIISTIQTTIAKAISFARPQVHPCCLHSKLQAKSNSGPRTTQKATTQYCTRQRKSFWSFTPVPLLVSFFVLTEARLGSTDDDKSLPLISASTSQDSVLLSCCKKARRNWTETSEVPKANSTRVLWCPQSAYIHIYKPSDPKHTHHKARKKQNRARNKSPDPTQWCCVLRAGWSFQTVYVPSKGRPPPPDYSRCGVELGQKLDTFRSKGSRACTTKWIGTILAVIQKGRTPITNSIVPQKCKNFLWTNCSGQAVQHRL